MTDFGSWRDGTSDLLYRGSMRYLLDGLRVGQVVVDLGGGNGLSRAFLPGHRITTVDIDPATEPDVLADALDYQHHEPADTVLLRYLLHYLTDHQLRLLFANLTRWHAGNVVVVQFANLRPQDKAANSADRDVRYWRSPAQLLDLLRAIPGWRLGERINRLDYTVQPEFYTNRLGQPGLHAHSETLLGVALYRRLPG